MKQLWRMIERYYPWLLLLLGVDCFCAIILWISDIQAFLYALPSKESVAAIILQISGTKVM